MNEKYFWQINDGRIWSAEHAQFVPYPEEGGVLVPLHTDGKPADLAYLRTTIRFYGYELGELAESSDKARELCMKMDALDIASIRPARAVAAGTHTQADIDKLAAIEAEVHAYRAQLAKLQ